MEKTANTVTDDIDGSRKTQNIIDIAPERMSDHGNEKSFGNSVTTEEVACQNKAMTVPLS